MREVIVTDQDLNASRVKSLLDVLHVRLDDKKIQVSFDRTAATALAVGLLEILLTPKIENLRQANLENIRFSIISSDTQFGIEIDISDTSIEGLQPVRFVDWNSLPIELNWVPNALRIIIPFESTGIEATRTTCGVDVDVEMDNFKMVFDLVPYVVWLGALIPSPVGHGSVTITHKPQIYQPKAERFITFVHDEIQAFGADFTNADFEVRRQLDRLEVFLETRTGLYSGFLIGMLEALFIGERPIADLLLDTAASQMIAAWISSGRARFLYPDENDVTDYHGRGRIVEVRKNTRTLAPNVGSLLDRWIQDNIIEVRVEAPDGSRKTISVLNLIDAMERDADDPQRAVIDGVHVVHPQQIERDVFLSPGRWTDRIKLVPPPYLRANPDASLANNLDRLPVYDYPNDPLYSNLYDGNDFVMKVGGLGDFAQPRRWKGPTRYDYSWGILSDPMYQPPRT